MVDKLALHNKTIWMIGDNPENDIRGAKDSIKAVTLQKIHDGVDKGIDQSIPDIYFEKLF